MAEGERITFDHLRTYLVMVEEVAKGSTIGADEVASLPREDWKVTINTLLAHRLRAAQFEHMREWLTGDGEDVS